MNGIEVHRRYFKSWDIYYAVIATANAVAILGFDGHPLSRRLIAAGAIAAMVLLHAVAGRRLIESDRGGRAALLVLFGQVALFAVATSAVPFSTWLLFALTPLILQTVSLRQAVPMIILANLVPVGADLIEAPGTAGTDLLIAAISTATGIWLGFWIGRVIEQNVERGLLIDQLEASRAEVARLSHTAGVAAERARLAGEIHDTLAQGFTSIITLLQAVDPALRDDRLALAVRTAKENLAESRSLIAALSPSASLPDSVRRQASRFEAETGRSATVRITGSPRVLPTAVEVVLLRAAQEALTNVRRHAGPVSVQVLLAYAESGVRLVVRDDGCGFSPGDVDGFGLSGMRTRAEQVNGTLTVASATGAGTTIELEVSA